MKKTSARGTRVPTPAPLVSASHSAATTNKREVSKLSKAQLMEKPGDDANIITDDVLKPARKKTKDEVESLTKEKLVVARKEISRKEKLVEVRKESSTKDKLVAVRKEDFPIVSQWSVIPGPPPKVIPRRSSRNKQKEGEETSVEKSEMTAVETEIEETSVEIDGDSKKEMEVAEQKEEDVETVKEGISQKEVEDDAGEEGISKKEMENVSDNLDSADKADSDKAEGKGEEHLEDEVDVEMEEEEDKAEDEVEVQMEEEENKADEKGEKDDGGSVGSQFREVEAGEEVGDGESVEVEAAVDGDHSEWWDDYEIERK